MAAFIEGVVIIGGAAGSQIAQEIYQLNGVHVVAFMNNFVKKEMQEERLKSPVLGDYHKDENLALLRRKHISYFVATGNNRIRKEIVEDLMDLIGKHPINAIHPWAKVSPTAEIGWGNLIVPMAYVRNGCKVGNCTILNAGARLGQDVILEDYVQIAPGVDIGGYSIVKEQAMVGIGACTDTRITIGEGALVAGGAFVKEDVEPWTLVAGVPAVYKKDIEGIDAVYDDSRKAKK